jgi:hypothetical protein
MKKTAIILGVSVFGAFSGSVTATAAEKWSDPIAVDFRVGQQRYVTDRTVPVTYSRSWALPQAASASVLKVTAAGTDHAVTSTVQTTGTEGVFSLAAANERVRLIHQLKDENGAVLSELVRDVAFGVSRTSEAFFADTTTNGLQRLADDLATTFYTYEAAWMPGGTSVRIEKISTGLSQPAQTRTNLLHTATGSGVQPLALSGRADCTLRLSFWDEQGQAVGETWTVDYALRAPLNTLILIH